MPENGESAALPRPVPALPRSVPALPRLPSSPCRSPGGSLQSATIFSWRGSDPRRAAMSQAAKGPSVIDVKAITQLQRDTVADWHRVEPNNPYHGFLHAVCEQHKFNFLLWHEEDVARSPDVGDGRIAAVKRAIDGYNQKRNDWIERLDDFLITELNCLGVEPQPGATLNTETPGSSIDRLSILALRLYHMEEQTLRADATIEHATKARDRLAILREQHHDLSQSLGELLDDIFSGHRRLKLYRQFKMYNDPTLNPYLYQRGEPQPDSKRAA